MITRLSKQGGRRYAAMTMSATTVALLRSVGTSAAVASTYLATTFRMLTGAGR